MIDEESGSGNRELRHSMMVKERGRKLDREREGGGVYILWVDCRYTQDRPSLKRGRGEREENNGGTTRGSQ